MADFIISELAKKDITDIWNYTASEWSEEQAIRYYNGLLDTCERIAFWYVFSCFDGMQ